MTREKAIIDLNALKFILNNDQYTDEIEETLDIAIFALQQPEPKKGRWKRRLVDSGFNADWHCSECGWKTSLEEHGYNFCPNCGADMREGEADG